MSRWIRSIAPLLVVLAACSTTGAGAATSTVAPAASPPTTPPPTDPAPGTSSTIGPPVTSSVAGGQMIVELVTLDTDGAARTYELHRPESLGEGPVPLVIDLHGLTSTAGEQAALSGWDVVAVEEGFVVAYPNGRGGSQFWEATPGTDGYLADLGFLLAIVADVDVRVGIDTGRVFATGMSNGAGMAHRLACDGADVVAAVGLVAGAYPLSAICEPERPVAVMMFHGTDDRVVPFDGVGPLLPAPADVAAGWAERNGCSGEPATARVADDVLATRFDGCPPDGDVVFFTIEGGGHGWPGTSLVRKIPDSTSAVDATRLMWEFFEAHAR